MESQLIEEALLHGLRRPGSCRRPAPVRLLGGGSAPSMGSQRPGRMWTGLGVQKVSKDNVEFGQVDTMVIYRGFRATAKYTFYKSYIEYSTKTDHTVSYKTQ